MELLLALLFGGAGYLLGYRKRNQAERRPVIEPGDVPPGAAKRLEAYDLRAELPKLEQHTRTLLEAFGSDLARQPPVRFPPPPDDDRVEYLKRVVRIAARRYGVRLSAMYVRFVSTGFGQEAASIQERPNGYFMDVLERYRDHDAALAVIAAHELAHYAMSRKGIGFAETQENEELTDTLMVLAGFGPLMTDVYHQELFGVEGDQLFVSVSGLGYLHPTAVAYLTLLQLEIAGLHPQDHIERTSIWYAEPWKLREQLLQRPQPERGTACRTCGSLLPEPDSGTMGHSRCSLCRIVQRFPVGSHAQQASDRGRNPEAASSA